jgi:hypothetical protein
MATNNALDNSSAPFTVTSGGLTVMSGITTLIELASSEVTGVVTVTDGGVLAEVETGAAGTVFVGTATSPKFLTAGTATYVLTSQGAGSDPQWAAIPGGSLTINPQTASYGLVLSDAGKLISCTHASTTIVVTIPLNNTQAFAVGTQILVYRGGVAQVNIAATGGVTLQSAGGLVGCNLQYSMVALIKLATDTWFLGGDTK